MKKRIYIIFSLLIILAFFSGYLISNIKDGTSTKTISGSTKYTTGVNIEKFGAKSVEDSPGLIVEKRFKQQ
ncbi:hypothetical protein MUB16_35040 [Priestia sp. OVL9]|nr:hypothetical protein [Priestia sp. OVL9]MCJ7987872.1 hypothetical protein [Priestia sp. OVL9]